MPTTTHDLINLQEKLIHKGLCRSFAGMSKGKSQYLQIALLAAQLYESGSPIWSMFSPNSCEHSKETHDA